MDTKWTLALAERPESIDPLGVARADPLKGEEEVSLQGAPVMPARNRTPAPVHEAAGSAGIVAHGTAERGALGRRRDEVAEMVGELAS